MDKCRAVTYIIKNVAKRFRSLSGTSPLSHSCRHMLGAGLCLVTVLMAATLSVSTSFASENNAEFDVVISGGRVIDPETGLDAIRHVGIRAGRITAISEQPLLGHQHIDAHDRVVAPGFIDIHSHSPTLLGQHLNLLDGVTTQLDLEAGAWPVAAYGDHFTGGAQLHYGSSVSHAAVRMKVIDAIDQPYFFTGRRFGRFGGNAWVTQASEDQIAEMRDLLRQGLHNGGLGIGLLLDYMTAAITPAELRMVFETAAEFDRPVTVHVRRGLPGDPSGLEQVIAEAEATGAPTLICHITHSAMSGVAAWLEKIDAANARGANISTETLSWLAGGTSIAADVFQRRNWRAIFDIDYGDVQWIATGEWLTESSFEHYQATQPEGMVNHHYVKEAWLETALKWPGMMVSTDALPAMDLDQLTNPNIAGTFSQFLGRYVRERQVLELSDALARITLKPAQWLEAGAPAFRQKGRIQLGADADVVVFNPATIAPRAKYGDPYQPSQGIDWVVVGGQIMVASGQRIEGRYPGKHLLVSDPSTASQAKRLGTSEKVEAVAEVEVETAP